MAYLGTFAQSVRVAPADPDLVPKITNPYYKTTPELAELRTYSADQLKRSGRRGEI